MTLVQQNCFHETLRLKNELKKIKNRGKVPRFLCFTFDFNCEMLKAFIFKELLRYRMFLKEVPCYEKKNYF